MGMRISTNVSSIAAQRALNQQTKAKDKATAALSTGKRINRASDDAAGLAIAENMNSDMRSTQQARSNAFNAISAIQVGEGGLNEVSNILVRLKELGVQSASDTLSDKERVYIHQEASSLKDEMDRIVKTTKFGEKNMLDGSSPEFDFHVGVGSGSENIISYKIEGSASASDLNVDDLDLTSKSGARSLLGNVDQAINKVSKMRAGFGAIQSRLETTVAQLDSNYENIASARSKIMDADIAQEASKLASATILQNSATSLLAQVNQEPYSALKLLG